jgi:hypothetical protein
VFDTVIPNIARGKAKGGRPKGRIEATANKGELRKVGLET